MTKRYSSHWIIQFWESE